MIYMQCFWPLECCKSSGIFALATSHKWPIDESSVKWACQEHFWEFKLFLEMQTCVLGQSLGHMRWRFTRTDKNTYWNSPAHTYIKRKLYLCLYVALTVSSPPASLHSLHEIITFTSVLWNRISILDSWIWSLLMRDFTAICSHSMQHLICYTLCVQLLG